MKKMDNFKEEKTVEDANEVNLSDYTFLERLSATKGMYCFKIRERKRLKND